VSDVQAYKSLRYDLTKARTLLTYTPQVTLRDGLEEIVKAVLERDASPPASKNVRVMPKARPWSGRHLSVDELRDYYDQHLSMHGLRDYYNQSDFWNYGYWYADTKNQQEACENLMEELLSFIPEKKGTILDVACGQGATTRYLLKYFVPQNVTGINISEKQLQICRKNAPECTFLLMDATQMDFPDHSFDNVICVEAAMHFNTRKKFLREAHRVLKPGGCLVLSDMSLPRWRLDQPQENYVESPLQYKQVCLQAGFADVTVVDTTEECSDSVVDYFLYYMREKLNSGEIGLRQFYITIAWRLRRRPEMYLLAACIKE
jgi:ubiquinone/menaquinone biosynthesis C-methylase UbiE